MGLFPQDLHVDAAISGFALGYAHGLDGLIGSLVAPELYCDKQSGYYWVADKKNRIADISRAPGDLYKNVEWSYSKSQFQIKSYGAKSLLPVETSKNADMDADQDAVAAVVETAMLNAEKRVADIAFNASVFTNTGALSGTARWDSTAPDPFANARTANASIRSRTGFNANTLVLGHTVWTYLRAIPSILSAIYGNGPKGIPSPEQVANALGLDRILVGNATYYSDAGRFVDIWGKRALFAYYSPNVNATREKVLCPMRTFVWNVDGAARFQVSQPFMDRDRKSWARYVDDYTDEKAVSVDAGYLFTTVIS